MDNKAFDYFDLIRPLFDIVDTSSSEVFLQTSKQVPHERLIVYAAYLAGAEIHNGGLLQFFWNQTGVLAAEALQGFHAVGMPQLATVFSAACDLLGQPIPRERDDRWDALLIASHKTETELEAIFQNETNLYIAFATATESIGFAELNESFWKLGREENGGFEFCANQYLGNQHHA